MLKDQLPPPLSSKENPSPLTKKRGPIRVYTNEEQRERGNVSRMRRYRTNPEYRAKRIAQIVDQRRKRLEADPEYRAEYLAKKAEQRRKKSQTDPEFWLKEKIRKIKSEERREAKRLQEEQQRSTQIFPTPADNMHK
jgi:hypothetical protein